MTKPELAVWTAYYIELSHEEAVTDSRSIRSRTLAETVSERSRRLSRQMERGGILFFSVRTNRFL